MGNESSLVRDCKLEKEVPVQSPKAWRLYQSRRRDGSRVSVFVYEPQKTSIQYIDNAAKYLKVLRHPSILKFDGIENTSDGVWLATEQVTPLENRLEEMSSAEIVAGIYSILEALIFLHERGGLCHNNICMSSLFVSEDGVWKLGGVEYLCRFDQASAAYLAKCRNMRDKDSLAPEENVGNVDTGDPGWARDVYAFGILVQMLLEYVTDLGDLTKSFEIRIQEECLSADPNRRPKLNTFLQDPLFKNDFLEIINFLKNITLKTETEKRDFFWDIVKELYAIQQDVLATRLVHPLLSRFVLLDATACSRLLPHLLTPYKGEHRPVYTEGSINPLLSEKLFRKHVIPELFKIFHVRDIHIRSVLLCHFSRYVQHFDKDILSQNILPQVLLGIRDINDDLVHLSLLAIAQLVPVLGGDTVVGPHRLKLFVEATPKFGDKQHLFNNHINNGLRVEPNGILHTDKSCPTHILNSASDLASKDSSGKKQDEHNPRKQGKTTKPITDKSFSCVEPSYTGQNNDKDASDVITKSHSDWSDRNYTLTSHVQDNVMISTECVHDKNLEVNNTFADKLESSLISGDACHQQQKKTISDKSQRCDNSCRGALKLQSQKIQTSPPPCSKVNSIPTVIQKEHTSSQLSEPLGEDHAHCRQSAVQSAGTWDANSEDDQWNGDNWQDIDSMTEDICMSNTEAHSRELLLADQPDGMKKSTSPEDMTNLTSSKQASHHRTADVDITSLDIKTLPIKVSKEPEIDFFADMQPDIKVDGSNLWGVLNDNKTDGKQLQDARASERKDTNHRTISFAAAEIPENEVGEAWADEDVDWGSDV